MFGFYCFGEDNRLHTALDHNRLPELALRIDDNKREGRRFRAPASGLAVLVELDTLDQAREDHIIRSALPFTNRFCYRFYNENA